MAGSLALDDTLGAAYIGNILAACLYGLTTLQTYTYFSRNQRDPSIMVSMIGILWILDTLHLTLVSHTVYSYTVSDFGNIIALLSPTWSVLGQVIVTGVSDAIVRFIFCYRIWILSDQNVTLVSVLITSTLIAFGCSLAFPIAGFQYSTFVGLGKISWILYLGLASVALSDLLMSATLCVLLDRRRSNFERVNGVVRTLILYSINTCVLTTICALSALIAYAASPHTFIYIAFYFLLPKLFLNSLLATLNARKSFRQQLSDGSVHIPLSSSGTGTREIHVARSIEVEIAHVPHIPSIPRTDSMHDMKGDGDHF